jgi:hypothetical protein
MGPPWTFRIGYWNRKDLLIGRFSELTIGFRAKWFHFYSDRGWSHVNFTICGIFVSVFEAPILMLRSHWVKFLVVLVKLFDHADLNYPCSWFREEIEYLAYTDLANQEESGDLSWRNLLIWQ